MNINLDEYSAEVLFALACNALTILMMREDGWESLIMKLTNVSEDCCGITNEINPKFTLKNRSAVEIKLIRCIDDCNEDFDED